MLHIRQRRLLGYVTRKHTFVNFAMVVKRVVWFFYLCSLLIASSVNSEDFSDGNKNKGVVNCNDARQPGPCFGFFPRWFFNRTSNKCTEFIYGGCRGNGNNFESKEECERKCTDVHVQQSDDELSSHSGQETPKGPCAIKAARKKLLNAIIFHGAIVHFGYTPDCDEEGYYKTMQCRHKTRREEEDEEKKKCWCVDRWGNCIKKDGKGRCKRGQPDELNCS